MGSRCWVSTWALIRRPQRETPTTDSTPACMCISYSGAAVQQQLLLQVRCCYPATVLYQLMPNGGITWPLPYCGDWWHRPYASVLLEMERVVSSSLQQKTTSFPGHTQCLLHCTDCSHQVVRGTSELMRGTIYQAARLSGRAAAQLRGNVASILTQSPCSVKFSKILMKRPESASAVNAETYSNSLIPLFWCG